MILIFDVAKEQSNQNPVYYIQYAYARICRIKEHLEKDYSIKNDFPYSFLESKRERGLLRRVFLILI